VKTKVFYMVMALAMALSLVAVALPAEPAGANGPETLWVGECGGEPDYDYIQDAIDNADPGDTIMVCPGEYDEQLKINKQLTILSANGAEETLIDGDGVNGLIWDKPGGETVYPTVWIDAAGVVFGDEGQGFTVFGGWSFDPAPWDMFPALLNLCLLYTSPSPRD